MYTKTMSFKIIIVFILLFVGLTLRWHDMGSIYRIRDDEHSWLLAGTSLLQHYEPTSWTIRWPYYQWSLYKKVEFKKFPGSNQTAYALVTPWLDHPPLFAALIGGWTLFTGNNNLQYPNWFVLRQPMIVMSVATLGLTFLVIRKLFNEKFAIYTLAAYTFFPAAVVSSRFILAENAIPLWLMASLLSLHIVLSDTSQKIQRRAFSILLILCYTAPLLKLSGFVVPASVVLILLLQQKYKHAGFTAIVAAISLLSFIAYGWWFSWDIFIGTNSAHMLRPQSFSNFWSLFYQKSVANIPFLDPSLVAGFIGLCMLLAQPFTKARQFIFVPFFLAVISLLVIAPIDSYTWYKFPLYPLLAIGVGWILYEFQKGTPVFVVLLLPMIAWTAEKGLTLEQNHRKLFVFILSIFFVLILLLPDRFSWLKNKMRQGVIILLFGLETLWIWNLP